MEFFTLITITILAIISGIITGLIPGLHINFISILILINYQNLNSILPTEYLIIFIIIMSLTHTFIDFIPSIIFGIPNSDTALSILPGHKLILDGKGYKAIYLSAIGSLIGIVTSIIISVFFYVTLTSIESYLKLIIPYLLIIIILAGILLEPSKNQKFWALAIILFTGGYGILLLNSTQLNQPLLILFTAIFGTANIINSLLQKTQKLPKQNYKINHKIDKGFIKSLINGTLSSSLCAITPGIGNMQAATISQILSKTKSTSENFICQISLINTNNFLLSLITFYLIEKSRNGSIYVISQIINQITIQEIIKFYIIIIISAPIIFYFTLKIGKFSLKKLSKLNFKKINIILLIFLTTLITILEGYFGLLALISGTLLGFVTILLQIKRIHLMSALLIPIILYFI